MLADALPLQECRCYRPTGMVLEGELRGGHKIARGGGRHRAVADRLEEAGDLPSTTREKSGRADTPATV
jgi:hypothetical protein